MKTPVFWLKDWIDIPENPHQVAEKLVFSGTKIESIETVQGEAVYETEITSNRPDCLSMYGIAREIAAVYNLPLKKLEFPLPQGKNDKSLQIKIPDTTLCPVYSSIIIDNVSIKPSPEWLVKRLTTAGIRSINTVVDISNYVMWEYGIPMHTFDYDKITGATMTIRASQAGEKVTTLDGVERVLQAGTILIEDSERIIDLAGIMGGQNSEVDGQTKTVFLHVPVYDPLAIRKASKYLGLRSEASTRYEKKLDLMSTEYALAKAVNLFYELTGGHLASEMYHENHAGWQSPVIHITTNDVKKCIGIEIDPEKITNTLKRLEFTVEKNEDDYKVIPPSFRRDIERKEDVIEEIARIHGYNRMPLTLPDGAIPLHSDSFSPDWRRIAETTLTGLGFTEIYSFTMTSKELLHALKYNVEEVVKVLHPMSQDFEYLRPSLISGLLQAVQLNMYHLSTIRLFEIGTTITPGEEQLEKIKKNTVPDQPQVIGFISTEETIETFKGKVEFLLTKFGIDKEFNQSDTKIPPYFASDVSGSYGTFGYAGLIQPEIVSNIMNLTQHEVKKMPQIWYAEFLLDAIIPEANLQKKYKPLPKYPSAVEDVTLVVPDGTKIGHLINTIKSVRYVAGVELINIYGNNRTFRITYLNPEQNLNQESIARIRQEVLSIAESTFNAKLKL